MKLLNYSKLTGLAIFGTVLLIQFQNCGKKLSSNSSTDSSSTSVGSSSIPSDNTPPDHSVPHLLALTAPNKMLTGSNLDFKINEDVPLVGATYLWSHTLGGAPNACLVVSGSTSQNYTVKCSNAGTLKLSAVVTKSSGEVLVIPDITATVVTVAVAPLANLKASFSITAGTGTKAWNTAATPIEVYVGQTLTITNNDTTDHQMHTGGAPCPHGTLISPGTTFDCVITKPYSSGTAVYEHLVGSGSQIFLVAHDGKALYAANCASCHGAVATSAYRNATLATILNAQKNIPQMSSVAGVAGLSALQIEAISYALSH